MNRFNHNNNSKTVLPNSEPITKRNVNLFNAFINNSINQIILSSNICDTNENILQKKSIDNQSKLILDSYLFGTPKYTNMETMTITYKKYGINTEFVRDL